MERVIRVGRTAVAGLQARAPVDLRRIQATVALLLGVAGTAVALGFVVHELWNRELAPLAMLATSGIGFWAALIASLLVEPVTDCWTLRRLLGTGTETIAPLVHKQSLNTLLFGYSGDAFFAGWLQKHIGNTRGALALVCDMAIVSALVNNAATLAMLVLMWKPIQALPAARIDSWSLSLAIILVAAPLALMLVRRRTLPSAGLSVILAYKSLRTLVATFLIALTWHYAMPSVPLLSWLLLLTGRMVVSRLPIVPNKDLAFAGCVSILLGPNDQVAPAIAGVALISLAVQAVMIAILPLFVLPRRPVPQPANSH